MIAGSERVLAGTVAPIRKWKRAHYARLPPLVRMDTGSGRQPVVPGRLQAGWGRRGPVVVPAQQGRRARWSSYAPIPGRNWSARDTPDLIRAGRHRAGLLYEGPTCAAPARHDVFVQWWPLDGRDDWSALALRCRVSIPPRREHA